MNVLHPAGVVLEMSGGEVVVVVGGGHDENVGEIVWAGKVLGLAAREGKSCHGRS